MIDLDDDDSPPPPPKSAAMDKLAHLGISISRQKAPQLPKNVAARLPPGISISGCSGASSSSKRSNTGSRGGDGSSSSFIMTPSRDEPVIKRVAAPDNVAGMTSSPAGASKTKVQLELNEAQINTLKALGMM